MSDTTPQELSNLADALTDASHTIDRQVNTTLDPLSPQGQHLRDISAHIAFSATQIRTLAVAALAQDVKDAIADLTHNVDVAKQKIAEIEGIQRALSIAAALLSVAAAVVTKDPLGAVSGISNLIDIIKGATGAA
jgi:uncharacterized protein YdgA (DUF945 family)